MAREEQPLFDQKGKILLRVNGGTDRTTIRQLVRVAEKQHEEIQGLGRELEELRQDIDAVIILTNITPPSRRDPPTDEQLGAMRARLIRSKPTDEELLDRNPSG